MYAMLLILLFGCAFGLVLFGLTRQKWSCAVAGILIGALTTLFFWFLSFWGEALWFESVGYSGRFWKVVIAKVILAVAGACAGAALLLVLTWPVPRRRWPVKAIAAAVAAYIGAQWAIVQWDKILLLLNRVSTDVTDPILGRHTGFYLFVLPVYNAIYGLLLTLTVLALIVSAVAVFVRLRGESVELRPAGEASGTGSIYLSVAAVLFVLSWGKYLDRFNLMYSQWGAVAGPGWTDVHVRLPAYTAMIILMAAAGLILAVPFLRDLPAKPFNRMKVDPAYVPVLPIIAVAAITAGAWFILLMILPGLFQWLRVQPNEITLERPYIEHNIAFTRRAFNLGKIEERQFAVSPDFTRQTIEQNRNLFDNIRLWDWRALDAVYSQFQEIRLYYEFADVDVDRYTYDDKYRQVMVAAREIQLENLPAQSQTFVNRRFKYTHGNGITLTPVSEFTAQGLPDLLIQDIPPRSRYPELVVKQPRIYYGELTDTYVIANSREEELDYPSGDQNVYTRYEGRGGVRMSNLWRKFLFGWKFDGTRLLFSGYPTAESRIMFHRKITDRVKTIAPFLEFDDDPYIVLVEGKLYWIIDAYTVSSDYPYSEPAMRSRWAERYDGALLSNMEDRDELAGINYIRNSVKVVVDAYHGSVSFYIFEPEDPLIRAWSHVFPGLFKDRAEMPEAFQRHVRYPADMLLIQGLVYAKYHMTDPVVFYNQEDLWVRATEKYYGQVETVQPYYIMWEPPDSDKMEFIIMLPFTPKNKQVLIAWIAGMCDGENYGRLLAYQFPKDKRVLGTQQVETKIDQDPVLSERLSLWDQRGSRVIRGNVLAIPVEDTLLYVEPIYLQAETAAYPELRLVAVMHDDRLSYAETFEEALQALVGERRPEIPGEEAPLARSVDQLIQEANAAFENYLSALGNKAFDQASEHLKSLSDALAKLVKARMGEQPDE
ncbi:MAG: UPF0182 family protein [Phycisphaerae bacterium]|nr:UPF0182 family protein [Phycisphaerae bacterium]